MRIIAGKARSLPLKSVPGKGTRPTPDRIKETLFNILQTEIYDAVFLDLFSGSGGIGLEALSRGARKCVFVEQDRTAADIISQNIAFTRMQSHATLYRKDFLAALKSMEGREVFDIIFADPPYDRQLEYQLFEYLKDSFLVEAHKLVKTKKYKTNQHIFVQKA